ncbi:MAG: STAS domain-containing protein [Clostridia bacterium]|nr:STAS domain-containing protein [Clostridia bacterium]
MLNIQKTIDDSCATLILEGRLDSVTSEELENELVETLDEMTELVFDLEKVEYISSAGLRVLLSAQKIMNKKGSMKVINVCDTVMEIFEVTGFSDILTIE